MRKKVLLTGDRPTGPLHLGHLVGSLENRVKLQDQYQSFFIIADYQVLYDHLYDTKTVLRNTHEILLDWLAVGLEPKKAIFFQQSAVPYIGELTQYFSYLVNIARLRRNPTIKEEAKSLGIDVNKDRITYGFLGFPVSQAADILFVKAEVVPVGADQLPHIEQTREIAKTFNRLFGKTFPLPKALISKTSRLIGLDGGQKMSKSKGNAILLSDPPEVIYQKVLNAYTDPTKIHISDPGHPETCPVCIYRQIFDPHPASARRAIEEDRLGKRGCLQNKKELTEILIEYLRPIRERRTRFAKEKGLVEKILAEGNKKACEVGSQTLQEVRKKVFGY